MAVAQIMKLFEQPRRDAAGPRQSDVFDERCKTCTVGRSFTRGDIGGGVEGDRGFIACEFDFVGVPPGRAEIQAAFDPPPACKPIKHKPIVEGWRRIVVGIKS